MNTERVKINEGFVAGVGLGTNTGFGVGRMTKGLARKRWLLNRFEDRRKDIIFDGQTEEQSLTIFPANESAMTIVSARFISEGETDRRGHSFCHGMIVDNETFSREILPYLDMDVFNNQFITSPQEELWSEEDEVLRFHPVTQTDTDRGESDAGDAEQVKRLYAFALKTIAAEAHYIVQIGDAGRKAFLRTLYELLPPPFRYRMESCSCGEYDQMFNVLIAADQPYTTVERYKTRTLNQILSADISDEEKQYPSIFRIVADRMERTGFYAFLEENVPYTECRREMSVQKIQEFLEKKAVEYLRQRDDEAGNHAVETKPACSEVSEPGTSMKDGRLAQGDVPPANKQSGREQTMTSDTDDTVVQVMAAVETILSTKGVQPDQWDELRTSLSKLVPVCQKEIYASDYETALMIMSEDDTVLEAERYLPNRRLSDLVDDYILLGNYKAFLELRNNLLRQGVGDTLRNIQRRRLLEELKRKDEKSAMKSNNGQAWNCYLMLIMLAYQMTPEEFELYQEKSYTDEILFGPYRYKEIERFINKFTYNPIKLMKMLGELCNPYR